MEINNPGGNRTDPFFVTNGRLVVEMVSGRIQTGENQYNTVLPAEIPVAGDTPGGNTETPTYSTLYKVANIGGVGGRAKQEREEEANQDGAGLNGFIRKTVIARLVRATHFLSEQNKLGRPDKPGDDGYLLR